MTWGNKKMIYYGILQQQYDIKLIPTTYKQVTIYHDISFMV